MSAVTDVSTGVIKNLREYAIKCAVETGYTIDEGEITRDMAIKTDLEALENLLNVLKLRIQDLDKMEGSKLEDLFRNSTATQRREIKTFQEKKDMSLKRLRDMRHAVKKFNAPTTAHEELKTYMLRELNIIITDISKKRSRASSSQKTLRAANKEEWREAEIYRIKKVIRKTKKELIEKRKMYSLEVKWMDDLLAELENQEQGIIK